MILLLSFASFSIPSLHFSLLSHLILSYLISSYLVLSYLISSYLILSSLLIISVQILLSSFIEWAAQLGQVRQILLLTHMIRWHNCIVLCRSLTLTHTHINSHTHFLSFPLSISFTPSVSLYLSPLYCTARNLYFSLFHFYSLSYVSTFLF